MAVQEEEIVFDGSWRDRLSYQIRVNRALQVGPNATRPAGSTAGMLTGEEMSEMGQAYNRKVEPEAFALTLSARDAAAFMNSIEPGEHPDDEAEWPLLEAVNQL